MSKIFSRNCSIIFVGCRFIAYFSVYGAVDILLWNVFFHKIKKSVAPGEARTHGLQIMRLTRCLLRYGGTTLPKKKILKVQIICYQSK